jgi:16S rRNA (guanine966-N2)-methyltransferase
VDRALTMLDRVYDVVFLDPPYDDPSLSATLDALFDSRLVSPKSTVVVQCSTRQRLPADFHKFHMIKNRHYGDTSISFYRQEARS